MPVQFKPKTQEDVDAAGLLPKGEYGATVLLCEEATSKKEIAAAQAENREPSPNMFKTKFGVFTGKEERQEWITRFIMADSPMLKVFADAVGLSEEYKTGSLSADQFNGRDVKVRVGIEAPRPKDDGGGEWPAKNSITGFVVKKDGEAKPAAPEKKKDEDGDDIPW